MKKEALLEILEKLPDNVDIRFNFFVDKYGSDSLLSIKPEITALDPVKIIEYGTKPHAVIRFYIS